MTVVHEEDRPQSPLEIVPSFRLIGQNLGGSLVLNGAAPFVAYQVLSARGVPVVRALVLTSVFPIAGLLVGFVRSRRADAIGVISLLLIAVGIAGSMNFGPRFYLVRVSFGTSVFGLLCLASLLYRRPLMFYLGRQVATGNEPTHAAYYDGLWRYPRFRHVQRIVTATWGIGYVLEAVARILVAVALPIGVVLLVEPIIGYVVLGLLMLWTIRYTRAAALDAAAVP